MIQTLYGLLAMMMVALVTLTLNVSVTSNQSQMILNEVSDQVTPIANEIFEHIADMPYDPTTITQFVTDRSILATEFGTEVCDPNNRFMGCLIMHDMHDKTITRTAGEIPFEIHIAFHYVEEDDPSTPSSTQTFSKKATLRITSPYLYRRDSSNPLEIVLTRVYSYPRVSG